jgi:hypothetical protein
MPRIKVKCVLLGGLSIIASGCATTQMPDGPFVARTANMNIPWIDNIP